MTLNLLLSNRSQISVPLPLSIFKQCLTDSSGSSNASQQTKPDSTVMMLWPNDSLYLTETSFLLYEYSNVSTLQLAIYSHRTSIVPTWNGLKCKAWRAMHCSSHDYHVIYHMGYHVVGCFVTVMCRWHHVIRCFIIILGRALRRFRHVPRFNVCCLTFWSHNLCQCGSSHCKINNSSKIYFTEESYRNNQFACK